eukprot:Gb_21579 [translate_table: standard]
MSLLHLQCQKAMIGFDPSSHILTNHDCASILARSLLQSLSQAHKVQMEFGYLIELMDYCGPTPCTVSKVFPDTNKIFRDRRKSWSTGEAGPGREIIQSMGRMVNFLQCFLPSPTSIIPASRITIRKVPMKLRLWGTTQILVGKREPLSA